MARYTSNSKSSTILILKYPKPTSLTIKQVALKESQQVHDLSTFTPKHAHELTKEQKRKALQSLIFLKQKNKGDIKGRACAG
mmetsp:Transcript_13737/g.25139  ORF Transcript_13737/g.25139 Transcript_13737/m.25139 type:complete len:82 (-) Transcript_13737:681-926(-)